MAKADSASRKTWPIWGTSGQVLVIRPGDLRPDEKPLERAAAAAALDRWASDRLNWRGLLSLYEELRGTSPVDASRATAWDVSTLLLPVVRQAFASRRLLMVRRIERAGLGEETQPEPPPSGPQQPAREVKTWVEFAVVDMEGNPVSGRNYKVMLPDGVIHEGTLGRTGMVRFDSIVPGTCVFVLPDLDQEAWERVS